MGSGGSSQALGLVAELIHTIILSSVQICTELFLSHAFCLVSHLQYLWLWL